MSYEIVKIATGEVVQSFGVLPKSFDVVVDGRRKRIVSPVKPGDEGLGYRFVERVTVNESAPGPNQRLAGEAVKLSANKRTVTRIWEDVPREEIEAKQKADDAAEIDRLLHGKLGKILFALARKAQPDLTAKAFRTWIESL